MNRLPSLNTICLLQQSTLLQLSPPPPSLPSSHRPNFCFPAGKNQDPPPKMTKHPHHLSLSSLSFSSSSYPSM
ncbi:hypothetical protein LguiA_012857 [Lonicera macranthoides]